LKLELLVLNVLAPLVPAHNCYMLLLAVWKRLLLQLLLLLLV
jgi:hypothetical protein